MRRRQWPRQVGGPLLRGSTWKTGKPGPRRNRRSGDLGQVGQRDIRVQPLASTSLLLSQKVSQTVPRSPETRPTRGCTAAIGWSYSLVKQPVANATPPGHLHLGRRASPFSPFPSPSRARDMERRERRRAPRRRRPGGLARSALAPVASRRMPLKLQRGRRLPGAPSWRFLFREPQTPCSGICAEARATSSQPGRSARPAVSRTSRARGYEPRPQDARSRSVFRIASRTRPLIEQDAGYVLHSHNEVNIYFRFVIEDDM
jgi:hypothetical protein